MKNRLIHGLGTTEETWHAWPALAMLPRTQVADLVPEGRRAVIVAPHPDDEILGTGGILAQLTQLGRKIMLVAVSNGEASHPGSRLSPCQTLGLIRAAESDAALAMLYPQGVVKRLNLPDGRLGEHESCLLAHLQSILTRNDTVFTPWRLDGHPDHEACGRAVVAASTVTGAVVLEVPIWTWHWASPGDPRIPWFRAKAIDLSVKIQKRKKSAVGAFFSQLTPDRSTGCAPVLPPSVLQRLLRPYEVVFQ